MALECNIKVLDERKTKLRPIELHSFGFSSNFENKEKKKYSNESRDNRSSTHCQIHIFYYACFSFKRIVEVLIFT